MYKLVNYILKKIRGKSFELDRDISPTYLLAMIFTRTIMLIRGSFTFCCHGGFFFRGKGVVIKAKNKIRLGEGVSIDRNCYIDAISKDGIVVGNQVSIGKNTTIECSGTLRNLGKGLIIGDGVGLGTHGFFGCAGGVEIGNDTIFGNFVSLHSENHIYDDLSIPIRWQGVSRIGIKIGRNCWIGATVTILDGAIIEDGCIIAAGSVVTKGHYVSNGIYGGVPANLLKKRE